MNESNNRRSSQSTRRPSGRQASERMSSGDRQYSGARSSSNRSSSSSRGSSSRQDSADRILAVQNARNKGSGNSRNTARSGSGARRRKRRRQGPDIAKILLIVIAVIIFIICVAVGLKGCSKDEGKEKESQETTTEPETGISAEITVNGISINGLTKTEAREKVLKSIGWDIKVTYNGETKSLPDMMENKVDAVLEEAYSKQELSLIHI